jgi:uncharacterized RDD family membrane protein YckC
MESEGGVYYPKEAYAGFLLRLIIDLIDISIVLVLCVGFTIGQLHLIPNSESLAYIILITWVLVWFAYFVLLKGSKFHTIGYMIGKIRIVNLQGNPPSLFSLTLRLLFAVLGPLNILIDLVWLLGDPHRQALRDKFAHTYVIKRNAQVVGRGNVVYRRYDIFGMNFLFPEVDSSDLK